MKSCCTNPPKGLLEKILKCIHKEQRFLVCRRIIFCSATLTGSMIAFIPTFKMLVLNVNQSGFLHFFSLTFSDFSTITTYWQSFAMILLETLPAVSLAIFLAILLIFLQSIRSLTKNIKIINQTNSLIIN